MDDTALGMTVAYMVVGGLICGGSCSTIASEKGYSSGFAFLTGLIFNLIGLIYYAGLPDKKSQDLLAQLISIQAEAHGLVKEQPTEPTAEPPAEPPVTPGRPKPKQGFGTPVDWDRK